MLLVGLLASRECTALLADEGQSHTRLLQRRCNFGFAARTDHCRILDRMVARKLID